MVRVGPTWNAFHVGRCMAMVRVSIARCERFAFCPTWNAFHVGRCMAMDTLPQCEAALKIPCNACPRTRLLIHTERSHLGRQLPPGLCVPTFRRECWSPHAVLGRVAEVRGPPLSLNILCTMLFTILYYIISYYIIHHTILYYTIVWYRKVQYIML